MMLQHTYIAGPNIDMILRDPMADDDGSLHSHKHGLKHRFHKRTRYWLQRWHLLGPIRISCLVHLLKCFLDCAITSWLLPGA